MLFLAVLFFCLSVRRQIIIIIIDTAFFFFLVFACVCTGEVVNFQDIQGKLAQRGATQRKVSTRRHLLFTGVLFVACQLCVCLFVVFRLPGLVFVFPCFIFYFPSSYCVSFFVFPSLPSQVRTSESKMQMG